MEWTFAPTLAVVRDDRWGRTYEGYSENPDVTASFAAPLIRGIQGLPGKDDFLTNDNVIATAKHFVGDGGTDSGRDQGDNIDSEEDLRDIHGAAYPKALDAGVQSVMISFSSWHGKKLTGHKGLITDVLKGQMGFDGFVVSDWNAQGQIAGCTNTNCLAALNAGIDMYMAPDTWKGLFDTMLAQAERGEVDMDRLDDAIRRVLRVKIRSGVMDAGRPQFWSPVMALIISASRAEAGPSLGRAPGIKTPTLKAAALFMTALLRGPKRPAVKLFCLLTEAMTKNRMLLLLSSAKTHTQNFRVTSQIWLTARSVMQI